MLRGIKIEYQTSSQLVPLRSILCELKRQVTIPQPKRYFGGDYVTYITQSSRKPEQLIALNPMYDKKVDR